MDRCGVVQWVSDHPSRNGVQMHMGDNMPEILRVKHEPGPIPRRGTMYRRRTGFPATT